MRASGIPEFAHISLILQAMHFFTLALAFLPTAALGTPIWQPWHTNTHDTCDPAIMSAYTITNDTRTFVTSLFNAVAPDNFGASFAAALSDDLTWTVTGSSLIAGTYTPKSVYISQVLTPLRSVLTTLPVPIVESIIVDGPFATIVWRSEGVSGKNGADYDMRYAWVMKTREETGSDGTLGLKIYDVVGFYDGQKVTDVFVGYDLEALRNGTAN